MDNEVRMDTKWNRPLPYWEIEMEAKDGNLRFDAQGVREHYQELNRQHWIKEGRKEVVEWVNSEFNWQLGDSSVLKWQAKLKEWGIE